MILTKLEVARRQINTAIRLYFGRDDEVSIHALAAGGRNVLVDLCRHSGIEPPMLLETLMHTYIKPEFHASVRNTARAAENFFKHADRDPENEYDFPEGSTAFKLLEGVEAFRALTGDLSAEMKVFQTWWIIQNKETVSDEAPQQFQDALGNLSVEDAERPSFFEGLMKMQGAR